MRMLLLALVTCLVGCTQASAPPQQRAEAEFAPLVGAFMAVSESAHSLTGNVEVERGGLVFDKGITLYTRVLDPRRASDLVSRDGDSYAAVAIAPAGLTVELRRVSEQVIASGGRGLCGADALTYIALAYERDVEAVTLMAFSGEEPPGPQTTHSRLCGAFSYAAPTGARTREGVVLR